MGTYGFKCSKGQSKFEIELTIYENSDMIYIVRFKKLEGEDAFYRDLCGKILQTMNL